MFMPKRYVRLMLIKRYNINADMMASNSFSLNRENQDMHSGILVPRLRTVSTHGKFAIRTVTNRTLRLNFIIWIGLGETIRRHGKG